MTDALAQYFSVITDRLHKIETESGDALRQAAEAVADSIQNDGLLLLFGSGHSALIAKDAAYRSGGLAPVVAIEDVADGDAERTEGLAKYIVARYELRAGNVLAIISNSGINAVPIEMALLAKTAGLKVIAITSLAHSQSVNARHFSGKKLYEVADIVIDTHSVPGDAAIELTGSTLRSGATSTVLGAAIVQALTVQTATLLVARGHAPTVWISANVPGGEVHNDKLLTRYQARLVRYQMIALSALAPKPDRS